MPAPPNPGWLFTWAQSAISRGLTPTQAYREITGDPASSPTPRFYRAYGIARANNALAEGLVDVPMSRRPTPAETGVIPTRTATGFTHLFTHRMRDPKTGAQTTLKTSVRYRTIVSRATAMRTAIGSVIDREVDERYPLEHLYTSYVGHYELTPGADLA